jgi:hypothetical protein
LDVIGLAAYSDEQLRELFKAAHDNGIFIRATIHGQEIAKCEELMAKFRNEPALLAWNVFDEVFTFAWGQENQPVVAETVARLQAVDPAHPVLINENPWGMEYIMKKHWPFPGAIVSIDHYAWTETPNYAYYADLADQMAALGEAEARPSWLYILGAGYAFWVRKDHSPEEHRFMAYSSVIHGITGIYYFADHPKSISALKAIQQNFLEFKALTPALGSRLQTPPLVTCASTAIDFTTRLHDGTLTIIAINKKRYEAVDAVFVVTGLKKGSAELPFENRSIDVDRGVFSDMFAPWQPHVYNIRLD